MDKKYVITISRQYGSGGREIGRRLAEALGIKYYNKELLTMAAEESGLCKDFIRNSLVDVPTNKFWYALAINPQALLMSPDGGCVTADMANRALSEAVNTVAEQDSCVIVGRYASSILKEKPNVLRIFITADYDDRLKKIMQRDSLSEKAAASKMRKVDKERATYADLHFGDKWGSAESYDLCINCSRVGLDGAVEVIKKMLEIKINK